MDSFRPITLLVWSMTLPLFALGSGNACPANMPCPPLQVVRDTLPPADTTVVVLPNDSLAGADKKPGLFRRVLLRNYPNPRMAALFSAVVPGAGQAYNRKWWKVPIVWGALGTIGYFTFDTQNSYKRLKKAYEDSVNGRTPESPYDNYDSRTLLSYRDQFRGYTEKWYLVLGVTYLLNVTDAFVDAHLTHFDISDDLSLRLKPALESTQNGIPALGFGIRMELGAQPRFNHRFRQ